MRSVAVLLLAITSYAALSASTDRVHPSFAVRSSPRRFLLVTIDRKDTSSPASPSRRELALESALDEEESIDLDPLDAPPRGALSGPLDGHRPEPAATRSPRPASTDHRRSLWLRC